MTWKYWVPRWTHLESGIFRKDTYMYINHLWNQKGVNRHFLSSVLQNLERSQNGTIFSIELAVYIRKIHLHVFYYSQIVFIVSTSVTVSTCVLCPYTPIIYLVFSCNQTWRNSSVSNNGSVYPFLTNIFIPVWKESSLLIHKASKTMK